MTAVINESTPDRILIRPTYYISGTKPKSLNSEEVSGLSLFRV